ncbi:MAG TPA: adenylate/guanylate cyclase domain-containing protein [Candidatus Limnocylindrales bacterium]|nr:adenylate/guanylate cyclase domain-containing protein [Candidatus Limnocylindrales bacterium]
MSDDDRRVSNAEWRDTLLGTSTQLTRYRRVFRHIPSDPRCKMCLSPQGGIGAPVMSALGYGRYPANPQLCNSCFREAEKHPGGAEIEMTALFADIRGSTGLAETMSSAEYSTAVDGYVRTASRAIREPGGLVDKLLGDGVMALFIPGFVDSGDHAGAAVAAARAILRSVRLPIGIGVHTGEAWVGFVGGVADVVDFTALGDAVNVAARLGSEAGAGELLMSASTATGAKVDTAGLEERRLELRGRAEPLDAWAETVSPTEGP